MDSEIYKEVIGGKEFSNYGYTTYYEELGMRQENYLRKQDDRIILLSITCDEASAERIPKLLDAFQAY